MKSQLLARFLGARYNTPARLRTFFKKVEGEAFVANISTGGPIADLATAAVDELERCGVTKDFFDALVLEWPRHAEELKKIALLYAITIILPTTITTPTSPRPPRERLPLTLTLEGDRARIDVRIADEPLSQSQEITKSQRRALEDHRQALIEVPDDTERCERAGHVFGDFLLGGNTGRLFAQAQTAAAAADLNLHVRWNLLGEWSRYPWEMIRSLSPNVYLGVNTRIDMTRVVQYATGGAPPPQAELRILALLTPTPPLDIETEAAMLKEIWGDAVEIYIAPTKRSIRETVRGRVFTGVHVGGHGHPGSLQLSEGSMRDEELAMLLSEHVVDFCLLNICEGVTPTDGHRFDRHGYAFAGVAGQLAAVRVRNVIGLLSEVADTDALDACKTWHTSYKNSSGDAIFSTTQTRHELRGSPARAFGFLCHYSTS